MVLSLLIWTYYILALTQQEDRAMLESNPSVCWASAGKAGVKTIPVFYCFPGRTKAINLKGVAPYYSASSPFNLSLK